MSGLAGTTRLPAMAPVIDPLQTVSAQAALPPATRAASETLESKPNLTR